MIRLEDLAKLKNEYYPTDGTTVGLTVDEAKLIRESKKVKISHESVPGKDGHNEFTVRLASDRGLIPLILAEANR